MTRGIVFAAEIGNYLDSELRLQHSFGMRKLTLCLAVFFMALPLPAQDVSAPPATSTVYFYRPENAAGSRATPTVLCDQVKIATIRNGQFISALIPPGKHTLNSTFAGSSQTVYLEPGTTYYFRVDMSLFSWRMTTIHGKLTMVLPEQGRSDVAQLQPIEPRDIKAEETVKP